MRAASLIRARGRGATLSGLRAVRLVGVSTLSTIGIDALAVSQGRARGVRHPGQCVPRC